MPIGFKTGNCITVQASASVPSGFCHCSPASLHGDQHHSVCKMHCALIVGFSAACRSVLPCKRPDPQSKKSRTECIGSIRKKGLALRIESHHTAARLRGRCPESSPHPREPTCPMAPGQSKSFGIPAGNLASSRHKNIRTCLGAKLCCEHEVRPTSWHAVRRANVNVLVHFVARHSWSWGVTEQLQVKCPRPEG